MRSDWTHCRQGHACPACGNTDPGGAAWCASATGTSGDLLWQCRRTSTVPTGWRLVRRDAEAMTITPGDGDAKAEAPRRDQLQPATPAQLDALAAELDLPMHPALPVYWDPAATHHADTSVRGAWAWLEQDGAGRVVGRSFRWPAASIAGHTRDGHQIGGKGGVKGGRRGLIAPLDLQHRPDPVLIVEGASDVLAAMHLELAAVGRPSNSAGADALAERLRGRRVVVLGEHDHRVKRDGQHAWPGRTGALGVATALAAAWGVSVAWALPPGAKDLRAWVLTQAAQGQQLGPALGQQLMAALQLQHVAAPTDEFKPDDFAGMAASFLARHHTRGGQVTLRRHAETWWQYLGTHYAALSDEDLDAQVNRWLQAVKVPGAKRGNTLRKEITGQLRCLCNVPQAVEMPSWLAGDEGPAPRNIAPFGNGLLDVTSGELWPHSPNWFSANVLPYQYEPSAECPRWEQCLREWWGPPLDPDDDCAALLQMWCGYLLTADTSQQKIMLLIGKPGSGKGTCSRVIQRIVGAHNTASPMLNQLGRDRFALTAFIAKTLAAVGDARMSGMETAAKALVVQTLKWISGEDPIDIPRHYKPPLSGVRLPTRLMLLFDHQPEFRDESAALMRRLLVLPFDRIFAGATDQPTEGGADTTLDRTLAAEAPGILQWAIRGRELLQERVEQGLGFPQPRRGLVVLGRIRTCLSPLSTWFDERCELAPAHVTADELFGMYCEDKVRVWEDWGEWCGANGMDRGNAPWFGRALLNLHASLGERRPTRDGDRVRQYCGFRLRPREVEAPSSSRLDFRS